MVGLVGELRRDALLLGDVLDLHHGVQRVAGRVADERDFTSAEMILPSAWM